MALTSFTGSLAIRTSFTGGKTQDSSSVEGKVTRQVANISYTYGTGSNQCNFAMSDVITLAPAGSTDYDLDGGALVDILGDVFTAAKVKMITIENTGATNALTISGDFLELTTDAVTLEAGGVFAIGFGSGGRTVTATTGDVITIASTGGTSYKIEMAGVIA